MAVREETEQQQVLPKKKPLSDEEKRRMKIVSGALKKALIRPGAGDIGPVDGDRVIYHYNVRTLDGVIVESTKAEFGGE